MMRQAQMIFQESLWNVREVAFDDEMGFVYILEDLLGSSRNLVVPFTCKLCTPEQAQKFLSQNYYRIRRTAILNTYYSDYQPSLLIE